MTNPATRFYEAIDGWIDKSVAFPLPQGADPDDQEPIWLFRWQDLPEEEREETIDDLFGDCEPSDFTDICVVAPVETPHGTVHDRALKPNWLPFAITMVDLEEAVGSRRTCRRDPPVQRAVARQPG